ncbi:DUF4365 domain-containing protein [Mycolicibacterium sp. 018/SC-01/001]|uniref:DUF4365 domain-containing protein n=1 Tax=Mycolicibacterium sp. 018/SC-01/001 TaxID=2592069 RepID=UPI00163D5687|nr:DUF4365 domain-containing protein [Mycolicibacterium sp. 018/SC-01/001]
MAKQASLQETVGTAGQSTVAGQFEALNWGVASNPYHDLGTDLWLMARDDRRFDLGLLVGAQVKTSKSRSTTSKYFKEPKHKDGKVVGWWYRESLRDDHFDYWIKHTIPHILVLHDLRSGKSFWVHVTREAIVRTSSGTKILVPKDQRVGLAHVERLLNVAVSQRGGHTTWEGSSSWADVAALGPEDRIRYALLTPRLIASRRAPRQSSNENPTEAIAMLVQHRLMELDGTRDIAGHLPGFEPPPFLSEEEALAASDWDWNFYGALHKYVHTADPEVFQPLIESSQPNSGHRAAAVAIRTATLIEHGRIDDALDLTDSEISAATSLDPVNFAWIEVQRARCLMEVGKYKKARELAIHVQRIQATAAADPTAMAIAASAAGILLRASFWTERGANFLSGNDTAAGWWRNQTIAQGLETFLDDRFTLWSSESADPPKHMGETWRRLRTATLLSGFAGDHSAWRTEYAQLAQYVLQAHPNGGLSSELCAGLLTDLRRAGDIDSVEGCAQRLLRAGPEAAVRAACASVELRKSTHSTGRSDLGLIATAAAVLEPGHADRFIQEAVDILKNPQPYEKRVRPTFLVHHYVLETLRALVGSPSATSAARRVFIDYFFELPPVTDQSFAHSLAQVLRIVPRSDWTASDLAALMQRSGDNGELEDTLVGITAVSDDDAREALLDVLRRGQIRMLSKVHDVRTIPQDVAQQQIATLSGSVRREIQEARGGTFSRHDARNLALLNIWFPEVADWAPIYELMDEIRILPRSLIELAALLRDTCDQIDADTRDALLPGLQWLRDRTPLEIDEWQDADGQLKTVTREALDALSPGAVSDTELWGLIGGDNHDRCAAARIVGRRGDISRLDILACLSYDEASTVRAHSAHWIARWLGIDAIADRCNSLLEDLSRASGTVIAAAIAGGLTDQGRAAAGDWLASLPDPTKRQSEDE